MDGKIGRVKMKEVVSSKHDISKVILQAGITAPEWIADTMLRQLPDGSLAVFFLGGPKEGWPRRAYISRSYDNGQTWTKAEFMNLGFSEDFPQISVFPTDFMTIGAKCILFCGTQYGPYHGDWRCWYLISEDNCQTWSSPIALPEQIHRNSWIQNHLITRDGRIVLCFQHYVDCPGCEGQRPDINPRNGVLISKDNWSTWSTHGWIRTSYYDVYNSWAEPQIVELADNVISMLVRARYTGVLMRADSLDGGYSWPEFAYKTDIPNPGSKFILYDLGKGKIAILHNPVSERVSPSLGRYRLELWISEDGMRTWPYRRIIDEQFGERLTDPDGFVSEDNQFLHFVYNVSREKVIYYRAKLPS